MYRPTLAFVQHRGFGDFARAASPELLRILRANGIVSGRVVDLGCGDGTWLRTLTRAGFAATGVEQSAALVGYARRRAPEASVRQASLHGAAFPRCEAITALGEVLNYLQPGNSRPPSLARLFRRAHAALRPGGLLLFDLLVSGRRLRYDAWREGRGWAVLGGAGPCRRRPPGSPPHAADRDLSAAGRRVRARDGNAPIAGAVPNERPLGPAARRVQRAGGARLRGVRAGAAPRRLPGEKGGRAHGSCVTLEAPASH